MFIFLLLILNIYMFYNYLDSLYSKVYLSQSLYLKVSLSQTYFKVPTYTKTIEINVDNSNILYLKLFSEHFARLR